MLYLNKDDILTAVTMKDVIDAVDTAYEVYQSKQFQMPTRLQVKDDDHTLLLMPCMTNDAIGTKLVTSFPHNKNHPVLHGLVILNSQENGEIMALIDGSFITGFRTGAIGGSAIRHLAKEDTSKIAIIGTGVQGLYQAVAACTERSITDIYLYNRTPEKVPSFIDSLQQWIGHTIQIHAMDSVEEAITHAEVIITATTSKDPVLPDNPELLAAKLIIGIGSFQPTMREFPKVLYQLADHIFIDTEDALAESGDIATPLENNWIRRETIQTMASFLTSKQQIQGGKTVVFKSTGMALFDVVVTNLIYQRAMEKGVGQNLT
ncbi:ornithine cyclodeaminase family protein [Virgibacillus necropolis]|uniref:Ornithine cyclodeaminase n=1 Tax=Virgibacillus necropolis TaxID=163877 RepID=A0A221M9S8_9BACI|nr:ornithine cyclodeaminase family protein [Virgibacillus necropolis]ASN04418.1 ornithine cyclodeaminase [Virgibacillus necropolis]